MGRVQRYDLGTLQKPRELDNGFLIIEGYASRVGTYDYQDDKGNRRVELRLEDDVFSPTSLDTFTGAAFTDDHPADFVDVTNADGLLVGTVLSAVRDGEYVRVQMVITDAETIAKMKAGKRELSVGYTVDHEETPGEHPKYGKYDAIQRDIRVNHLALVDEGRAGPKAAVRMDARFQVATKYPDRGGSVCISVSSRDLAPRELVEIVASAVAKIPDVAVNTDRRRDATGTIVMGWTWGAEVYVSTEELSANALMAALGDALDAADGVIVNRCDGRIELSGTELAKQGKTGHHAKGKPMAIKKRDEDQDPNKPADADPPAAAPSPSPDEQMMGLMRQLVELQAQVKQLSEQLAKVTSDRDEAVAKLGTAEGATENAKTEIEAAKADAAKAKSDAAVEIEKAQTDAQSKLDGEVLARVKLLTDANTVLGIVDAEGKPVDRTALAPRAIKLAIIKHVDGKDVPDTETREPYIDALVEGALERHARGRSSGSTITAALNDAGLRVNLDTSGATAESVAAKKNKDSAANAWRTKKGQ